MTEPLVIINAGGLARETAQIVRAINQQDPTWDLLGFLDDKAELIGTVVDGIPVLGPIADVHRYFTARVAVSTGYPGNYFSRPQIVARLDLEPDRYATIVHPASVLPGSVEIEPGSVVHAGVVATDSARIGAHVVVMPHVTLYHDVVIDSYATVSTGVRLAGQVHVGEGAYLGVGSLVREERTIGAWALVGMGAVVLNDVPSGEVWAGVPARHLRDVQVPANLRASISSTP